MENKVKKNKKVDKDLNLKIFEDPYNERIYVEFSNDSHKLVIQKSFQNTVFGNIDAEAFAKSIKSTEEFRTRLGITA